MKDLIYTTNFKNCETEVVKKFERLRSIAIKTGKPTWSLEASTIATKNVTSRAAKGKVFTPDALERTCLPVEQEETCIFMDIACVVKEGTKFRLGSFFSFRESGEIRFGQISK